MFPPREGNFSISITLTNISSSVFLCLYNWVDQYFLLRNDVDMSLEVPSVESRRSFDHSERKDDRMSVPCQWMPLTLSRVLGRTAL